MKVDAAKATRQEYDRLAASYDKRWRRYLEGTLRKIVKRVRFQGNERILDAPCGTGELEQLLLSHWPDLTVVGVDLSAGMLRQAAAKLRSDRGFWVQADVTHLPFPDEHFDVVLCANSFHYFHSPVEALHEIFRVLRPGGQFVLVDWCDDYLSCKLCSLWLRWTDPAFQRSHSLQSCRSLLEATGFDVIHAERFHVGWIWGMMQFVCRRSTSQ
jgi:ubiquinone/menaquinone biosynthesis C-methylase UbiE